MRRPFGEKKLSSFQIVILGFLGAILLGTLLLMLIQTHIGIGYRMLKVD